MTVYLYSTIANGQEIDFDPAIDVLSFDDSDVSAADFALGMNAEGDAVTFEGDSKSFTLAGIRPTLLSETNVTFADGSVLLSASLANSFSSALTGSAHDDVLIGGGMVVKQLVTTPTAPQTGIFAAASGVSADGRYVLFVSDDPTLDGNPPNQDAANTYVKDLLTGAVTQVSSTSAGKPGNQPTFIGAISGDGHFVVLESAATNFSAGDTNGTFDIFLKNLETGAITLVSTRTGGDAGLHAEAWGPSISYDGRYVAFSSAASDLVANDTNESGDVFVKDMLTGEVRLVSCDSDGVQGNYGRTGDGSLGATISADGQHLMFASWSDNLAGDTDWHMDVFVKNLETGELVNVTGNSGIDWYGDAKVGGMSADGRYVVFQTGEHMLDDVWNGPESIYWKDLQTGEVQRVCVGWDNQQSMAISGDGRYVVFSTMQAVLEGDTNNDSDVYVRDMQTGTVVLVSQTAAGQLGNGSSLDAKISLDGSTISFTTWASNLVPGDTNGTISAVVFSNPLYTHTLAGGAGDDTYYVSNASDVIVEAADGGIDTARSSVTLQLAGNVENLVLTGHAAINATGNQLGNALTGNDAANTLNGGLGVDTMSGGAGNDTYVIDRLADVIVETAGMGVDTVQSALGLTLQSELENLVLTGSADVNGTGNTLANALTGNAGANALDGGAGDDTLNGGTGIDTLTGGSGNDTYVLADTADTVVELVDGGIDTLQVAFTHVLQSNFENLTLTGMSAINATGNATANSLVGNKAANVLDAGAGNDTLDGGAGADKMIGGTGDDVYFVDSASDQLIELAGAGTDTVNSSVSFTLQSEFERLTLTGSADINGFGNALANAIIGNDAANLLDGGAGADTLTGGGGNDAYVVDNAGDVVVEAVDGGYDRTQSSVSLVLQAQVEDLVLTGDAAIDGTGNALRNSIAGNLASNILKGGAGEDTLWGGYGGEAADTLMGGADNDEYQVNNSTDQIIELAGEGTDTVYSGANFVLQANVENLELIYNTDINGTGNALANTLRGNVGDNVLNGAAGADTMTGAEGDDTYVVDNAGDETVELVGGGTDLVQSSITHTLKDNIENLTLTGTSAINGTGNALANTIVGNAANNVLDGGVGADSMSGGAGNDTYVVTSTGDKTIELAGGGTDLVLSSITHTLQAEVENLTLTGSSTINGTGNALANDLVGNTADNVLNGGAGADSMTGGSGNDTYFVDNSGDKATELAGGGTDLVQASASFILQAEVENLTLTGISAINGTGNTLANTIVGNVASNVINGGSGADSMTGGSGNDTYVVDNAGDVTFEVAGGGIDLVQSSISFTLQSEVENLTLTGTAAINGTGNALGNVLTGNSAANVLSGGAGNDTYVVDNVGDKTVEAVDTGIDTVQSSISFTLQANVEYLTLTGSSAINGTGNSLRNDIVGNAANNVLNGGADADTMSGGAGNDTYIVDNASDFISELAGGGTDLVQSSVDLELATNVENLTLVGPSAIHGRGNALVNTITGNATDNVLDGAAGADSLTGGAGDDTYIVDNAGDKTIELAGGGDDLVESSVSHTLQAEVENLTLTGFSAINGMGNTLANTIVGNWGDNRLDGAAGADSMTGHEGNDTYIVDNSGDKVIEDFNGGIDLVQSSVAHTLQDNVENLTLTGTAVFGTGNALANVLTGNAADNTLNGGAGVDTLIGGAGNDTYVVDSTQDDTVEVAGQGTDTVRSSVGYTLQDNVENLTLIGTAANGTGNDLANVLTGNAADNTLNGGVGADTLIGGAGNDSYVVDSALDKTIEEVGGGIDTVRSLVAHTLQDNVENLTLIGTAGYGTGNSLANTLLGNASANVLDGKAGADTLTGGAGADIFAFTSSLGSDLITDFASSIDKLRLSQAAFHVGDGDTAVENAVSIAGPNGFNTSAELVIVSHDIAGALTTASAAAAIGHANSNYAVGDTRLFVVDNGGDSVVYLFKSADANSTVSATELTLLATLDNTASTTVNDYLFGV